MKKFILLLVATATFAVSIEPLAQAQPLHSFTNGPFGASAAPTGSVGSSGGIGGGHFGGAANAPATNGGGGFGSGHFGSAAPSGGGSAIGPHFGGPGGGIATGPRPGFVGRGPSVGSLAAAVVVGAAIVTGAAIIAAESR
jgi:hypothetical protein